jgi:hypothetical protein
MVYTTVSSILTIPYDRVVGDDGGDDGELPMPVKRLFLEMPYKPRITPMVGSNSLVRLQLSALHRPPTLSPALTNLFSSNGHTHSHSLIAAPNSHRPRLASNSRYRSHDRARTRTAADVGSWGRERSSWERYEHTRGTDRDGGEGVGWAYERVSPAGF